MENNNNKTAPAYKTAEEARAALRAKIAELNAAVKSKSVEQITLRAEAAALSSAVVSFAELEHIAALCSNPAPAAVLSAYIGNRRINIPAANVTEERDKESGALLSYKISDKAAHFVDLPAVVNYWSDNHAGEEHGKYLTAKGNYTKYVEMFLYTATAYCRVRDGKSDWSIPNMSASGKDLFDEYKTTERTLKNAEKVWTGTANRDHFDKQTNAVIRAIFPAEVGLPALRAEDRRYILDTIVFTVPGQKRYGRVNAVNLYRAIFDAIEMAKDGKQWQVNIGDGKNVSYDGGFSAKTTAAEAEAAPAENK